MGCYEGGMDILVLRLIHILGGAFWFGSAFTLFLFLQPTADATVPESQRFMLHLLRNRRLSEVVLTVAILTAAAGGILFWRDSNGLQTSWISQPQGLGFTVGAVAGLGALLLFTFVGFPAGRRLIAIGSLVESERRPPNEDEQRVLRRSQAVLKRIGIVVLVLLAVAAGAMSTARYWGLVL
jgi:uncharacterized membrane protein